MEGVNEGIEKESHHPAWFRKKAKEKIKKRKRGM
jgi:hypothetical protein